MKISELCLACPWHARQSAALFSEICNQSAPVLLVVHECVQRYEEVLQDVSSLGEMTISPASCMRMNEELL